MINILAYKINFKLEEPISISFHTWHYRENIILKLKWKNYEGLGEAAPFKPITGDSQQEVINEVRQLKKIPLNPEKNNFIDLSNFLEKNVRSQTLKCAIDFAYHDLLGKIKKIPVYGLYIQKPRSVLNSVTVFIKESIKETVEEVQKIYKKYPHLRILKIKLNGKNDIERAIAIKKTSPNNIKFVLDANQGFNNPKIAVRVLSKIGQILGKVVLVEEPCPKGELIKLRYVKENLNKILVFADESAATIEEVRKVIEKKAADGINIKLQKAGGIWPAKIIANMCKKAGLKIMVGSMLEGPVAIAAGVHFTVSTPQIILSDLDMDLDLPKHAKGTPMFVDGKRIPSNNPGLGVALDFNSFKVLKQQKSLVFQRII